MEPFSVETVSQEFVYSIRSASAPVGCSPFTRMREEEVWGDSVLLYRAEMSLKVSLAVASFDRDSERHGQLSGQFVG